MMVMNDNEKRTGPVEDHRSKPRWSANKKMDAVLRLLRGEPLDELSRELEVEPHRVSGAMRVNDTVLTQDPRSIKPRPVGSPPQTERRRFRVSRLHRDTSWKGMNEAP